ncbi:MAG: AAA family ATPase [Dehalococcoidia bacterium]
MSKVLYVASLNSGDGKTALSAALARRWQQAGRRVEYLKPVSMAGDSDQSLTSDQGFLFARKALGLQDLTQEPIIVSAKSPDAPLLADVQEKIKSSYHKAFQDSDVVLIEGPGGLETLSLEREVSRAVSQGLKARVLLIVGYTRDQDVEGVVSVAEMFGEALLGVVINRVPHLGMRRAADSLVPSLKEAGVRVLGLVPETRVMFGITVGDLVERLDGRYALEVSGRDDLVECIMVGANLLDAEGFPAGPQYFGRGENKAVIAKGDRPDFQWAAMDTDTRCLILTGNHDPIPYVIEKARERQIPLAVVERDTLDILEALEGILSSPRLDQPAKLEKFQALMEEALDLGPLDAMLEN